MEIVQLRYIVTVVECNYNISKAAKKLFTSQSAISQVILNFERENNLQIFYRDQLRLRELTPFGRSLYNRALEILRLHDEMMESIKSASLEQNHVLRIGIPEMIQKVYYRAFFTNFMKNNPRVHLELYEAGSRDLASMLERHELDFAIIVGPTLLNPKLYDALPLIETELVAFMREGHPLAAKHVLSWQDFNHTELALFNNDFITYHLVSHKLDSEHVNKNFALTTTSWNFIVDMVASSDLITFFVTQVIDPLKKQSITHRTTDDAISFNVALWSHKKNRNITAETEFRDELINFTKPYLK